MTWSVLRGDCVDRMRELDEASVDAVVCDPPYGLEFMGKEWDRPWAVSARQGVGFEGREDNLTLPAHRDGRNANCRACGGRARGSNRCRCESPQWDRAPTQDMRDFQGWCEVWAREALRVLKPGGHLLAFGGTRTYHRLACAVEDAGFEIRDCVVWLYGSGFPKSLDVSKAIDKRRDWSLVERLSGEIARARAEAGWSLKETGERMAAASDGRYGRWYHRGGHMFFETGRSLPSRPEWNYIKTLLPVREEFQAAYDEAERELVRVPAEAVRNPKVIRGGHGVEGGDRPWMREALERGYHETAGDIPATPEAERWQGWGTALKPAHEPVVVARKPLAGTVAANVLEHGTGALNVDGCRIEHAGEADRRSAIPGSPTAVAPLRYGGENHRPFHDENEAKAYEQNAAGRWPANVVLDPEAARMLDEQTGELKSGEPGVHRLGENTGTAYGAESRQPGDPMSGYGDSGGASRFFYCAKASRAERNAGLGGLPTSDERATVTPTSTIHKGRSGGQRVDERKYAPEPRANLHPTVKPIALMRWLCRLVTPPGGLVLDPFTGSGTTGCAAVLEGFDFVGTEREDEYVEIAKARIAYWSDPAKAEAALAAARAEEEREQAAAEGRPVQLGLELDGEAA